MIGPDAAWSGSVLVDAFNSSVDALSGKNVALYSFACWRVVGDAEIALSMFSTALGEDCADSAEIMAKYFIVVCEESLGQAVSSMLVQRLRDRWNLLSHALPFDNRYSIGTCLDRLTVK
jgi:hypothetical protein